MSFALAGVMSSDGSLQQPLLFFRRGALAQPRAKPLASAVAEGVAPLLPHRPHPLKRSGDVLREKRRCLFLRSAFSISFTSATIVARASWFLPSMLLKRLLSPDEPAPLCTLLRQLLRQLWGQPRLQAEPIEHALASILFSYPSSSPAARSPRSSDQPSSRSARSRRRRRTSCCTPAWQCSAGTP